MQKASTVFPRVPPCCTWRELRGLAARLREAHEARALPPRVEARPREARCVHELRGGPEQARTAGTLLLAPGAGAGAAFSKSRINGTAKIAQPT